MTDLFSSPSLNLQKQITIKNAFLFNNINIKKQRRKENAQLKIRENKTTKISFQHITEAKKK